VGTITGIRNFDPGSDGEAKANADIREVAAWCNGRFTSGDAYVEFERVSRFEVFSYSTAVWGEVERERSVRVNVVFKNASDAVFFKLSWGKEP
jgi:hypothetical protein